MYRLIAVLALFITGCGSQAVIVNNIDEKEANQIVFILGQNKIKAEKITGSSESNNEVLWSIQVPSTSKLDALAILNKKGLPKKRSQSLLNLFANQGLVSSERAEQIRYQAGVAEKIAGMIRNIEGILDAEIQLSEMAKEETLPGATPTKQNPITAAVYIKHVGVLDNPNTFLPLKIKRLVASAIPGLSPDNVTIMDEKVNFRPAMKAQSTYQIVRVWGIELVHSSESTFRWIFFSMLTLLIIMAATILWLIWKIQWILGQEGGFKALFTLQPFHKPTEAEKKSALEEENFSESEEEETTAVTDEEEQ